MLYSTMVKQKTWTKPSHIDNTRQAYATDCCQNHWKGLCCVGVTGLYRTMCQTGAEFVAYCSNAFVLASRLLDAWAGSLEISAQFH